MKESVAERIIGAVSHCRTALLAVYYTVYVDLSSESMGKSDANMRDAINRGLITATLRGKESTSKIGSYEPRSESEHTCLPAGGDSFDGAEGARFAVRRPIAAGADIIQYCTLPTTDGGSCAFPLPGSIRMSITFNNPSPQNPNPNLPLFNQEKVSVLVQEGPTAKCPVACHAGTIEGAVEAGVNTLEHYYYAQR